MLQSALPLSSCRLLPHKISVHDSSVAHQQHNPTSENSGYLTPQAKLPGRFYSANAQNRSQSLQRLTAPTAGPRPGVRTCDIAFTLEFEVVRRRHSAPRGSTLLQEDRGSAGSGPVPSPALCQRCRPRCRAPRPARAGPAPAAPLP